MAKETKNTEKEKEKFIFIDTCIIKGMTKSKAIKTLTTLAKDFTIVVPSWQLPELQKYFIHRFTGKPKEMEQGLAIIRKELQDGFEEESKEFEKYFSDLSDKITTKRKAELGELLELLKNQRVIATHADHHYLGSKREDINIAPYEVKKDTDESYPNRLNDSIFWETMLQSSDDDKGIPSGSTLFIYSNDKGFYEKYDTSTKKINTFLRTEWELLKKGKLELYQEEVKTESNEEPIEKNVVVTGETISYDGFNEHKASGYLSRMSFLVNKMKVVRGSNRKNDLYNEMKYYYDEIFSCTDDLKKLDIAGRYLDKAEDILTDDIPF